MVNYNLERTLSIISTKLKGNKVYIHGASSSYKDTFSLKNLKTIVRNNGGTITNNYENSTLIIYNFNLRPVYNPTINDYYKYDDYPPHIKGLKLEEDYSMGELKKLYKYIIEKETEHVDNLDNCDINSCKYYIFNHLEFISYIYEP